MTPLHQLWQILTQILTCHAENAGGNMHDCAPQFNFITALQRMQRGLATRKLSVRLSNAWIVTKGKKQEATFLYHMKDYLS